LTIEALRTPDERFRNLPGYAFEPRYISGLAGFGDLRLHYLDEGPKGAEHTFLCLHGQPTWSYLYRKMIPVFTAAGHRSVAPDFFGFGRSDKPVDDAVYTFGFHRDTPMRFIEALDLKNLTLVCQDWGGILGLTLPMDMPGRFIRLLVMNTGLAVGRSPGKGFDAWKAYVAANPDFDIAGLMKRSEPALSEGECAAYAAPFPDRRYRAGVRRFPAIVPVTPDMEGAELGRRAAEWWAKEWSGPTFMAVGVRDPVLGRPVMEALQRTLHGCPAPMLLEDAGHFVQERGERIASAALEAWGTPNNRPQPQPAPPLAR